ncbi:hypothetical protein AG4045_023198 [Apium graveolens]|uniref:Uncharacterized protein n=1 Tax=Apium graveolens TaxID=4045 RepID=A0A6L5B9N8_APIGR|nr:hypothetical protein AG4045_023198 [Apium graveolens]
MKDSQSDHHVAPTTQTLVTASVPHLGFSPAPVVSPAGVYSTAVNEDRGIFKELYAVIKILIDYTKFILLTVQEVKRCSFRDFKVLVM